MFKELSEILSTVAAVGIKSIAILPSEDGGSIISGANEKQDVLIYDTIPHRFSDDIISIYGVNALLSRLYLFNQEKGVNIDYISDGRGEVASIEMKQGRRSATFHCYNYRKLPVGKTVPASLCTRHIENTVKISKGAAEVITSAISSMTAATPNYEEGSSYLSLESRDGDLHIGIHDGGSDNFSDVFEGCGSENDIKSHFNVVRFKSVMKESIKLEETISVSITEAGTIIFPLGSIDVIITPKE